MGATTSEVESGQDMAEDSPDSAELRSDIEATRSGMSETVDAIQARLSPQNVQETAEQITERAKQAALDVAEQTTVRLKETVLQVKNEVKDDIYQATIGRVQRMVDTMKGTTQSMGTDVMEMVKANPIPSALIGLGVAWLFMNKNSAASGTGMQNNYDWREDSNRYSANSGNYGYGGRSAGERMQQKASNVIDTMSESADMFKEKASNFVNDAQSQVGQAAENVQNKAQRVMNRSQSMLEENPLITGALALTVGAAIGLLLPETQRENEWMGEARNKLMGQVSEVAHDTMEKAQKVASEVLQTAGDKAQEEAKKQGLMGQPQS